MIFWCNNNLEQTTIAKRMKKDEKGLHKADQTRQSFQGLEVFKKCTLRSYCRPTADGRNFRSGSPFASASFELVDKHDTAQKSLSFNKKPNKDQQRSWVIKSKQHISFLGYCHI